MVGVHSLYKSILNFGQHHSSFDNLISPKRLGLTLTLENGGKELLDAAKKDKKETTTPDKNSGVD